MLLVVRLPGSAATQVQPCTVFEFQQLDSRQHGGPARTVPRGLGSCLLCWGVCCSARRALRLQCCLHGRLCRARSCCRVAALLWRTGCCCCWRLHSRCLRGRGCIVSPVLQRELCWQGPAGRHLGEHPGVQVLHQLPPLRAAVAGHDAARLGRQLLPVVLVEVLREPGSAHSCSEHSLPAVRLSICSPGTLWHHGPWWAGRR